MLKFIKYEIKGTYKFMLSMLTVVLIATTIIQIKALQIVNTNLNIPTENIDFVYVMASISVLVFIGAFIAIFIYMINSYKKELELDRGYLTFTLPMSGYKILTSKLLTTVFWYLLIGIIITVYNVILASIIFNLSLLDFYTTVIRNISLVNITFFVSNLTSIALSLIIIYFAITLSRVTFKNRRIGGVWFVAFIIITIIISYIVFKVSEIMPYYLNLETFNISNILSLGSNSTGGIVNNSILVSYGFSDVLFVSLDSNVYINIAGALTELTIIIGTFFATGYLLENKINI